MGDPRSQRHEDRQSCQHRFRHRFLHLGGKAEQAYSRFATRKSGMPGKFPQSR